jgi:hypothetical protein
MAQTYSVSDALGLVQPSFPRLIGDAQGAVLADMAQSMLWNHADWRTSISVLKPFYCTPFEQDFGAPLVIVPTDFQGLRTANLVQATTDPAYRKPLVIHHNLDVSHVLGMPELISYEQEIGKFRLWPRCGDAVAAPNYLIEGTYKHTPAKITPTIVGSVLVPIDDRFFEAYVECLRYQFAKAAKDPQAGNLQWNSSARAFVATGQMAIAMAALDKMATTEALDMGSDSIAPSESLMNW